MTKTDFSKIIKLITELFPQSKTQYTKAVIEAWYEALSDLDYEKARKGIVKYAQSNQWSPSIADIRKFAPPSPCPLTEEEFRQYMKASMERSK